MSVMLMRIPHKRDLEMCNLDVLERLADAWNPPEVEGIVSITEGTPSHTFHIRITGTSRGRRLQVFGPALPKRLLSDPEHRRTLAREARDFFMGTLNSPPETPSRTLTYC